MNTASSNHFENEAPLRLHKSTSFAIPIAVVGMDYRMVSTMDRARLILSNEEKQSFYASLSQSVDSIGVIFLETCNRVEWIVSAEHAEWVAEILQSMMVKRIRGNHENPHPLPDPYKFIGHEAVYHLLQVALGMKSLVVGEAQIAGQMNQALIQSQIMKTTSSLLNKLGTTLGRVAKAGFHQGIRFSSKVGVHSLALDTLKQQWIHHPHYDASNTRTSVLEGKTIGIIGYGTMGRKIASLLESEKGVNTMIFNRTAHPSNIVASAPNRVLPLSALFQWIPKIDGIIIATGSPKPILSVGDLVGRSQKYPLSIIDIGVPPQVEASVARLEGVRYFNIDHLVETQHSRLDPDMLHQAHRMIEDEIHRFGSYCRERYWVHLLSKANDQKEIYLSTVIPEMVKKHFANDESMSQSKVEEMLKKVVQEYSKTMFAAIHHSIKNYDS